MSQPDRKHRILFLDDERELLESLRASLRRERSRWDMRFFSEGPAALESLREEPAEVVVTDMQMPGMDGAEFLSRVRSQDPSTVRIVLSGQADQAATMRAVRFAHQWLAKPIERDALVAVLGNALGTLSSVGEGPAHDLVTSIDGLPVLPRVYAELTEALTDSEVSIEAVARIVESDPSAAARALQMANSAFFGLPRPMSDVREAVTFLGFSTLSQLVFAAEVLNAFATGSDSGWFEAFVRKSIAVSSVATAMLPPKAAHKTATSAGLLHGLGALVLRHVPSDGPGPGGTSTELPSFEGMEDEKRLFGANHVEVGAALLGVWGVPHDLVDAVARHVEADALRGTGDPAFTVGVARRIVEHELGVRPGAPAAQVPLDPEAIAALGGLEELNRLLLVARGALGTPEGEREAA